MIRSRDVRDHAVQEACRQLIRSCDRSYEWALYAEFMWGPIFFQEGGRFYDLKRQRAFDAWDPSDFYFPHSALFVSDLLKIDRSGAWPAVDFTSLKRFYERPRFIRWGRRRARNSIKGAGRTSRRAVRVARRAASAARRAAMRETS